jgi:hypothetical protein
MSDEAVAELLVRTNELLSVLVKLQLQGPVTVELSDPKKRSLYNLTDRELPIKELSTKVGMSTGAIPRTWQKWEDLGMLVKRNGKYRRISE